MSLNKKISVCIATCNGSKFIMEQLHSILPQLKFDDEIIISDDSSSDRTLDLIELLSDSRIHIYNNTNEKNLVFNFENALKHVTGDIIFLADQDDIWMPNKVTTMLRHLETADLVLSDCLVVNAGNIIIFPSFFEKNRSKPGFVANLIRNSYIGSCMAFNRKILDHALPFPSDISMHDWWIGLTGEFIGKSFFCGEKLIAYRRHQTNASATCGISQYNLLLQIKFRLIMLKNILIRNCF